MSKSYKHALSITSQLPFCSVPLRLDTYSDCQFSCAFCFAKSRGGNLGNAPQRIASVSAMGNRLKRVAAGTTRSALDEMLEKRVPIQFGGMTDPFSPWELKIGATAEALKLLASYDYPTLISTKSTMLTQEPYLSFLRNGNFLVRMSITAASPSLQSQLEVGVPTVSARLHAAEQLSKAGIPVSVRLQPVIPGNETHAIELVQQCASHGVRHVSAEYLKWPMEHSTVTAMRLASILPDGKDFYLRQSAKPVGREYVLPLEYKLAGLKSLEDAATKFGLLFGYADNEFLHLNKYRSCCNAADLFLRDAFFFEANILNAIKQASKNEDIKFSSITSAWIPEHSLLIYLNSQSRISATKQAWFDALKMKWNAAAWRGGPVSYYGVHATSLADEQGNKIYRRIV